MFRPTRIPDSALRGSGSRPLQSNSPVVASFGGPMSIRRNRRCHDEAPQWNESLLPSRRGFGLVWPCRLMCGKRNPWETWASILGKEKRCEGIIIPDAQTASVAGLVALSTPDGGSGYLDCGYGTIHHRGAWSCYSNRRTRKRRTGRTGPYPHDVLRSIRNYSTSSINRHDSTRSHLISM